jgi:hypothetical protein
MISLISFLRPLTTSCSLTLFQPGARQRSHRRRFKSFMPPQSPATGHRVAALRTSASSVPAPAMLCVANATLATTIYFDMWYFDCQISISLASFIRPTFWWHFAADELITLYNFYFYRVRVSARRDDALYSSFSDIDILFLRLFLADTFASRMQTIRACRHFVSLRHIYIISDITSISRRRAHFAPARRPAASTPPGRTYPSLQAYLFLLMTLLPHIAPLSLHCAEL